MVDNKEAIKLLLIEKLAGTIDEADDRYVETALRQDAQVRALWAELQLRLDNPDMRVRLDALNPEQSWSEVQQQLKPTAVPVRRLAVYRWAAAAAVLLFAGIAGLWYMKAPKTTPGQVFVAQENLQHIQLTVATGESVNLSGKKSQLQVGQTKLHNSGRQLSYQAAAGDASAALNTLTVPAKLDYQLLLADGTEVWLNSASALRFPFAFKGRTREVYLQGEAYFKVAKNAAQPFIVHTAATDIKVLGTSFNVNSYVPGETVTSLVEGRVHTVAGKGSLLLSPGQQALYTAGGGFEAQAFDPKITLAWMQGFYYFYSQRLDRIVQVLPALFDVEAMIDDPQLRSKKLSGALNKHDPLDVFLANIETTAGIHHYYKDGKLHLN